MELLPTQIDITQYKWFDINVCAWILESQLPPTPDDIIAKKLEKLTKTLEKSEKRHTRNFLELYKQEYVQEIL